MAPTPVTAPTIPARPRAKTTPPRMVGINPAKDFSSSFRSMDSTEPVIRTRMYRFRKPVEPLKVFRAAMVFSPMRPKVFMAAATRLVNSIPPPNQVFQTGIWSPTQPSRVPTDRAKANAPTISVRSQSILARKIMITSKIRNIQTGKPRILSSRSAFNMAIISFVYSVENGSFFRKTDSTIIKEIVRSVNN